MADQDIEGRPSSDGAETAPEGSVANDASTAEREIAMTDGAAVSEHSEDLWDRVVNAKQC